MTDHEKLAKDVNDAVDRLNDALREAAKGGFRFQVEWIDTGDLETSNTCPFANVQVFRPA